MMDGKILEIRKCLEKNNFNGLNNKFSAQNALGSKNNTSAIAPARQGVRLQTSDNIFDGNIYAINIIIGLLSAIVDNVPLVAGAMGMYEIGADVFAVDGTFWQFLAYCAGTGGSVLIIGSAAGVAVMGILKIDFIWYVKKISFLASFYHLKFIVL